jgi:drug/metabolite transporter (DMT)-like permease
VDVGTADAQLLGAALVLLAALLYAAGALLIRRISADTDPVGVITAILAINTVILAPVALPALPDQLPAPLITSSLVGLALLCTAAAFMAYFALIAEAGPSRATVVFYLTPVVTVAFGIALLGEPLTAGTLIGLVLIIAGSWLATGGAPPLKSSSHQINTNQCAAYREAEHAELDGPVA